MRKPYPNRYGKPILARVDTDIFLKTYFSHCLKCTFCCDACCRHGVDTAFDEVRRIENYAGALEEYTSVSREHWFAGISLEDDDFPGRGNTRTGTNHKGCIFLNPKGRGCMIHSFCLQNAIDYHDLKPMVSCLFPVTFGEGLLSPATEVDDKTLRCLGKGRSLYAGARSELQYYFGQELISELDALETLSLAESIPRAALKKALQGFVWIKIPPP